MTPGDALALTGAFARGARIGRRLHASPVKENWLVERRRERFVLRVDRPAAAALGLDRALEASVQNLAWRAGFAPEPVLLVPGPPAVFVTRYARGAAWRPGDLREPARAVRYARLLRRLHEARLPGPALDLGAACARYAAAAGTRASREWAARAAALLRDCEDGEGAPARCLCHNDPLPANVVGLRPSVLIDWEYAGVHDPLFDVAVALHHHRLARRTAATFTSAYFGSDPVPRSRLANYRRLYGLVRALWMAAVSDKTYTGR